MKSTREIVSALLKERQLANIPVRQPLASAIGPSVSEPYVEIIKGEVNIEDYAEANSFGLNLNITPELKQEGNYRELVRALQDMRKTQGLTPNDIISLVFETNEIGKNLIQKFETDMKKTALVSTIEFKNNDGKEIKIGELVFKAKIKK